MYISMYVCTSLTHSLCIGVSYEEGGAVLGATAHWGAVGLRVRWAGLGAGIRVLQRGKGGCKGHTYKMVIVYYVMLCIYSS